jgi:hypothetical protein
MHKLLIVVCLLWLSGCSGMRLVDTDVNSFATMPLVAPGASYSFQRLLSQQAQAERQSALEALVERALAPLGLKRDDAQAQYSVEVNATVRVDPPALWERPFFGWSGWIMGGPMHGGNAVIVTGAPLFPVSEPPFFRRQLDLFIRDLSSMQVVFETHASHDGRWSDNAAIFSAMLQAALKDFPQAPLGLRRINIEIPR